MTTVHATLNRTPAEAATSIRRQAAALGYALAEGQSGPDVFVFTKGVALFSWGSSLTVKVEHDPKTRTHLTVTTHESFAISDLGRGERAAGRSLDAVGAQYD